MIVTMEVPQSFFLMMGSLLVQNVGMTSVIVMFVVIHMRVQQKLWMRFHMPQ